MDLCAKKISVLTQDNHFAYALTATDLLLLGIGAGIFVLTGIAAATQAGPAIMFSLSVG